jgi:putative tryptophan/tyrosine transport system substrate-binding protein
LAEGGSPQSYKKYCAFNVLIRRVTTPPQVIPRGALGNPAALAAKAATTKIPVVFAVSANPIEIGLVASLNHPGANMTGVAGMAAGREQKHLELLYAAVPTASGLGFLLNPENSNRDAQINDALASAQKVGLQIKPIRASTGRDFSNVFAELVQSRAGGLVIADDEFFSAQVLNLARWRPATVLLRFSRELLLPPPVV